MITILFIYMFYLKECYDGKKASEIMGNEIYLLLFASVLCDLMVLSPIFNCIK